MMVIPKQDKAHQPYVEAGDALPPAYTEEDPPSDLPPPPPPPVPSSSSSSAPPPLLAPPTNFLTVSRTNDSVKGKYTIDPSMQVPCSVAPSVSEDGRTLNVRLNSKNGSIDAVIQLIRGPDAKGPALLETTSYNGSVSVTMHDNGQQHFRLLAASHNGAVTVRIPSSFTGPISTRRKNGKLVFTSAVQARLTTFSEQDQEGRFFVGDYVASGFDSEESWLADAVRIESVNGKLTIAETDEQAPAAGCDRKGFFSRFLG